MAYLNFSDALMDAKRRAQLQGRPVSQQEVQGIAEGFARSAAEKNIAEMGLEESKRQFTESLTQRKYETQQQIAAAEKAREDERKKAIGTGVGAAGGAVAGYYIGGAIGTVVGPGYGTLAGAAIGGAIGAGISSMCIIISSCTSPDSWEVNIARQYRDRFMDEEILTGYYSLCIFVAPLIQKFKRARQLTKKILVDRLVDYGECCLGYKEKREYWTSGLVKSSFLGLCRIIGKGVNKFVGVQNA